VRGALTHQPIQVQLERVLFGLLRSDYSQHAAYLSLGRPHGRPGFNNRRVRRAFHPQAGPQLPVISPPELTVRFPPFPLYEFAVIGTRAI
jgi:hypothetical protein